MKPTPIGAAALPCPICDAEVATAALDASEPACPACGQVLLPVVVAGAGRKSAAAALDGLVLLATAGLLNLGLLALFRLPPAFEYGHHLGLPTVLNALAADPGVLASRSAPFFVMASLYFGLFWGLLGRTPGQRLLGLRVVDRRGGIPGVSSTVARVAGLWLGLLPLGLGVIWTAFDAERRGLHDHVAGTWVVRST